MSLSTDLGLCSGFEYRLSLVVKLFSAWFWYNPDTNRYILQSINRYFRSFINEQKDKLSNFSFGAVSAVITCLAIITSFDINAASRLVVIGSLCVIALADNISDTLGIHIYQEGEFSSFRKVWRGTLSNFIVRLCVILVFILFVLALPPVLAVICSILYGFLILTGISYLVARKRHIPPKRVIVEHIVIASAVLGLSKYVTYLIRMWVWNVRQIVVSRVTDFEPFSRVRFWYVDGSNQQLDNLVLICRHNATMSEWAQKKYWRFFAQLRLSETFCIFFG